MTYHEGVLEGTAGGGDAQAIIDTATLAAEPAKMDPAVVYGFPLPAGGKVEVVDLEKHLASPRRTKGIYDLATLDVFEAFVKAQGVEVGDGLSVWVDDRQFRVTALFNDSAPASPAWRDHRARLTLEHPPEWLHWMSRTGKLLPQQEFAEHIEDGLDEIRVPEAADMLELAQSFFATTNAEMKSAQRLDNGEVRVAYHEEVSASAGKDGTLEIPKEFELALPPFVGESPYKVTARLRYRVQGGQLRIGYSLVHPDRVLRDAMEKIAIRLQAAFDGGTFIGSPAEAQG